MPDMRHIDLIMLGQQPPPTQPTPPAYSAPTTSRRPLAQVAALLLLALASGVMLYAYTNMHPATSHPAPVATIRPIAVQWVRPLGSTYVVTRDILTACPTITNATRRTAVRPGDKRYTTLRDYADNCAVCHDEYKGRTIMRGR